MKTRTFVEELTYARMNTYAVGAFNIFNYLSARAVIRGAQELNAPVILQTSASTVRKFGPLELGTMLRQLAWNANVNVLVHLDHCQNLDLAKACIDSGWDSIMYDGSHLPVEENIKNCQEIVAYAHSRGVQVEGELGKIGGEEDGISVDEKNAGFITVEEAVDFVQRSGIDAFAPAIGTVHGVYKGEPNVNFRLVEEIAKAVHRPIVIHGGTGLPKETFLKLIELGGSKINVSTAIKQAYIQGSKEYMAENPDKLDPIEFDQHMNCCIKDTAMHHIGMFREIYRPR